MPANLSLAILLTAMPFLCPVLVAQQSTADLQQAIAAIKQVDANGEGHEAAVSAMKVLNAADVDQLPILLAGMDGTNKLSANWLRSAILSVVGRSQDGIPSDAIERYFENKDGSHLGRLLAYDLLNESHDGWADKIVPALIDDPSLPLRRKGIKAWIAKAKEADEQDALGYLAMALEKARAVDQVDEIARLLDERGVSINLQKQLGFLHTWRLVGNFDNKNEAGFNVAYGPELDLDQIDLNATYPDMDGNQSRWIPHTTSESTGMVDLNEVIGKVKGATVYALANFNAAEAGPCEIRVGCINAHKVWLNGKLLMSNEIYHNGISPDKFAAPAELKKGDNQILVKICQNEQTEPWAQRWQFQLRVCDETGKAIQPAAPANSDF